MSDEGSLLITLLYQVAVSYRDASIYHPVRKLAQINPERTSRLNRFARTQFNRRRGILWTSQQHGISRLLTESSFALCTPTGSGKTLVANLALVKELLLHEVEVPVPLALYLVPSRALAGEVEAKLTSELGQDLIVTGLYGGTDWGITDYWLDSDAPAVLVATVEKADALMRYLGPLLLPRLKLLIIDEAHQVVPDDKDYEETNFADHSSRSIRLEGFVSRLLAQSPEIVRIALTAVAGGAASPVARWIEDSENAQPVGTNYRSTRQIIGSLEAAPNKAGRMLLELLNGQSLSVSRRREPVYLNLSMPPIPKLPSTLRDSIFCFNDLAVFWAALHLANKERRILISVAQQPEITMGRYKQVIKLSDWQAAFTFKPPTDKNKAALFAETQSACIDYCGEGSHELALLNQGVATNYGQMPHRLRRLMTSLIEQGICPITVATATLTEGVNLPFDIIFVTSLKRSFHKKTIQDNGEVKDQREEKLMSTAEFRNLSGRAGRPGASNGMEGLTLISLPASPSTTAPGKLATQQKQIASQRTAYNDLKDKLLSEEQSSVAVNGPLALLLHSIAERTKRLFGLEGQDFLDWLEAITPEKISTEAGCGNTSDNSRLADSLDELDGVLMSALEEFQQLQKNEIEGAEAEDFLIKLWHRTFSAYAAIQEKWLARAFIHRGKAIVEKIYPDADERTRLYQYGFTPHVGRRFELIAPKIMDILRNAQPYDVDQAQDCLAVFVKLGDLLAEDRGYGFRIRDTNADKKLLDNWEDVLAWWVCMPSIEDPKPKELRNWYRFISENIDFRLGITIGAVVAHSWTEGAGDRLKIPSLDEWKQTTGLPWFGFWARELLRWGTLDPFVAFMLAQGLAKTRDEAATYRSEFENWLKQETGVFTHEDRINPQLFLHWEKSRSNSTTNDKEKIVSRLPAKLSGTNGKHEVYQVIPIEAENTVHWIDAAGYTLAVSDIEDPSFRAKNNHMKDFKLHTANKAPFVEWGL